MGRTYSKVTIKCADQCNYGGCDKRNAFLKEYSRGIDGGRILFVKHYGEEDEIITDFGFLFDEDMYALSEILIGQNINTPSVSKEDRGRFTK